MPGANSIVANGANFRTANSFAGRTRKLRLNAIIAAKARELWANKVAQELAVRANISQRTAENVLAAETTALNGHAFGSLILSDEGPEFLKALVENLPPSKRARWEREFERAARRWQLKEQRDRLRQLESED